MEFGRQRCKRDYNWQVRLTVKLLPGDSGLSDRPSFASISDVDTTWTALVAYIKLMSPNLKIIFFIAVCSPSNVLSQYNVHKDSSTSCATQASCTNHSDGRGRRNQTARKNTVYYYHYTWSKIDTDQLKQLKRSDWTVEYMSYRITNHAGSGDNITGIVRW